MVGKDGFCHVCDFTPTLIKVTMVYVYQGENKQTNKNLPFSIMITSHTHHLPPPCWPQPTVPSLPLHPLWSPFLPPQATQINPPWCRLLAYHYPLVPLLLSPPLSWDPLYLT